MIAYQVEYLTLNLRHIPSIYIHFQNMYKHKQTHFKIQHFKLYLAFTVEYVALKHIQ